MEKETNFQEAAVQYGNNPTPANCQNYKTAGLEYIASLEDYVECVPTLFRQEFLDDLNNYRAEVNALDCN